MRNTDFNINALGAFIASDTTFQALKGMIEDLGLEIEEIATA